MSIKNQSAPITEVSFFPGCSLASSSREAYDSMRQACSALGLAMIELEDWNCCGSSSAHSLDRELGFALACRNLALAPLKRPLMAACPSCHKNLRTAQLHLEEDPEAAHRLQKTQGLEVEPGLQIVNFLEVLDYLQQLPAWKGLVQDGGAPRLGGIKTAAYYGCMLAAPRKVQNLRRHSGILERSLRTLGAEPVEWNHHNLCCGTFLSATRPELAAEVINRIIMDAVSHGAECLVTACAMCQMNLELRCRIESPIPVLHFAEALALALGADESEQWFRRHLIDPRPLLRSRGLL